MFRLLVPAAAVLAVSLPMTAGGYAIQPQLDAKVSTRSLSLLDSKGQRVHVLLQNSYRIVVKDSAKTQNFHLVGPGVNLKTKVAATGVRVWVVNLRPGTYVYKSDRSAKLHGTFRVRDVPPPA